jgi:hypothetical protein
MSDLENSEIIQTDGFVIYQRGAKSSKVEVACDQQDLDLPIPDRQVPDWLRSANSQTEYETHLLAPVYQDGKPTGQWQVHFFRDKKRRSYINPHSVKWDRVFDSRDEAEAWIATNNPNGIHRGFDSSGG